MSVNIEGLSSKELAELISRANQRKKVLAKRRPAAQVKAAVSKLLKASGWKFDRWLDVVLMQRSLGTGDTTPGTD